MNLELFNIPIYYGEEELFFANLISEIYQYFCVQKEIPKKQNLKKIRFKPNFKKKLKIQKYEINDEILIEKEEYDKEINFDKNKNTLILKNTSKNFYVNKRINHLYLGKFHLLNLYLNYILMKSFKIIF